LIRKNKNLCASYGFTLAEVLLVLVIVGVIASLTIPDLVNNIQKILNTNDFNY